jgi:uncharacterized protein (DUF4415 family)
MKKPTKPHVTRNDAVMPGGKVLTEADFEAMATAAETTEPDYEAIAARARAKGGRPSLGEGVSPVLQVRLDASLRQQLVERAKREHTTPSSIAREAIQAFLAS